MGGESVTVLLPPAAPEAYLRWMSFWRQVEQRRIERPALNEVASAESAPSAGDRVANFLSSEVVTAIMAQAAKARREGGAVVMPSEEAGRSEDTG